MERLFKWFSDESKYFCYDENCLVYMVVSEVMFYFFYGIVDVFGVFDVCGVILLGDNFWGDFGGWEILRNVII